MLQFLRRTAALSLAILPLAIPLAGAAITTTLAGASAAYAATSESLKLVSGWVPYDYGYAAPTVARDNGLISVGGVIRNGSWSGWLAQLPTGAAPKQRLIFSVNNHDTITRVDVLPNGYLIYAGGSNNHGWVSLEGITFASASAGGTPLALLNGWSNYGHDYAPATATKSGNTVVIQGLIKSSYWQPVITKLPEGMRPAQRMTFGGNVHTSSARIDVLPNGDVVYIGGRMGWEWISLSGIAFTVGSTSAISLASGMSNYGGDYASASVATADALGSLRPATGLVTSASGQIGLIGTLPPVTGGRRIFSLMRGNRPSRVDLLPDGRLYYISGGDTGVPWISLSGFLLR